MNTTRHFSYALALVVAATSAVSVGPFAAEGGDTNGDRHVDVLDVQRVVFQVLNGSLPDRAVDVNADGRIDILDLQRVLAQATQAQLPRREAPAKSKPDATPPAMPLVPMPLAATARRFLSPIPEDSSSFARWSKHDCIVAIPRQTERYLYALTPHAPPHAKARFA